MVRVFGRMNEVGKGVLDIVIFPFDFEKSSSWVQWGIEESMAV